MGAVRSETFPDELAAAPRSAAEPLAAPVGDAVVPEAEFIRHAAPLIEHELFRRRFTNWRLALLGMAGITWMIAAMYRYLNPAVPTLRWALYETLAFLVVGGMCLAYERRRPADLGSPAQRRWMLGWTLASSIASANAGLLPWFLPAADIDAQLSSAALVSILMMAFVVSRANRMLIYCSVGAYALTLSLALALHTRMPWAVPVCLVFTAMLLGMGLMLNVTLGKAIGDQMYAQYLHGELRRSHTRQLAVQQREAALNERQRMMSDLHDGFGAQLIGALRQLEGGHIGIKEAVNALRDCIEDLRLTVDAHEPAARSLATLLGMLRYRMQARQAPGLKVHWATDELPESAVLSAAHSLDLLRILQQAVTNVLQHAEAREIRIVVHRLPRQLEIAVEDDGKGLDPAVAALKGRGIANMQRRAARMGAELLLEPREGGGTALRLLLRWPLAVEP